MSATVSIIENPDYLSPILNSPAWFVLDTTSSTASNFKYTVTLFKEPEPFIDVFDELQTYKLPPRPFGECEYSPSKYLESFFGYTPEPYVSGWTHSDNALLRYKIEYGYEFNPNVTFQSTSNLFGDLVLQTLGTFTFSVGDVIRIDKDNKQVNPGYDGLATVQSYAGGAIRTNLSHGLTQSNESGRITSVIKKGGTSSTYEAFYGTRQYDERTFDFSQRYIIGPNDDNKFLQEYTQTYKPTLLSDYETISMILGTQTGWTMNIETYQYPSTLVGSYSNILSASNSYRRMDYGVGPQNIIFDTGSFSFFDNIDYYKFYVTNNFGINFAYTTSTYSYSDTQQLAGFFNGAPYYEWNDGVDNFVLWYSSSNNWWEVTSILGGGNQWLVTATGGDYPPNGSILNSTYLTGIDGPLFVTFKLTNVINTSQMLHYSLDNDCNVDENFRFVWLNRLGGWDYFNFKLGGKQTINVERETYKKLLSRDYSVGDRGDTTYAQKSEEMWSVQSNWITEAESEWLRGMIESREVYHMKNGDIYPIQIMDTSYQVKSAIRDQIFNVVIQFKYAFNRVI